MLSFKANALEWCGPSVWRQKQCARNRPCVRTSRATPPSNSWLILCCGMARRTRIGPKRGLRHLPSERSVTLGRARTTSHRVLWGDLQMKAIICGALMAPMVSMAHAAEDTHSANYILQYCKLTSDQVVDSPSQSYLLGRCAGLVEGVSHMAGLLKAMQTVGDIPHLDPLLCAAVPEQVTIQEVLKVVVRYGETHPKEGPLPFTVLVLDALHDAWPCK